MKVNVLREAGMNEALLGLGLSYGVTSEVSGSLDPETVIYERMKNVAMRTARKGGSHAKWLESVCVWLDIVAPRYWWQEFDTYRVGTTKQSESTMHTIKKRLLVQEDFEYRLPTEYLAFLNEALQSDRENIENIKNLLPEGFLQRRVVTTNYKVLAHIIGQRFDHKLFPWREFVHQMKIQLEHIDYLEAYCGMEERKV